MADEFPKGAPKPDPDDMVQVLMPEWLARRFEDALLSRRAMNLDGPVYFAEDDVPTYILGVKERGLW